MPTPRYTDALTLTSSASVPSPRARRSYSAAFRCRAASDSARRFASVCKRRQTAALACRQVKLVGTRYLSPQPTQAASSCLDHPLHGSWHLQRGSECRHHVRPTSNMVPHPFVKTGCPSVVWNRSLSPAPEGGLVCCPPLRRCSPKVEFTAGGRGFEKNLYRRLQAVQFVARRHASVGGAQLWAGRPARARERRARCLLHRRLLLQLVQLRVHLR